MSQNDYHPQGMNGYGQPNTYFQNYSNMPQNAATGQSFPQNSVPGQGYPGQSPQPAAQYNAHSIPAGQGYAAPAGQGYSIPAGQVYAAPSAQGYAAPAGQGYSVPAYQPKTGYTTPQVPFTQGSGNNNYLNDQIPVQPYTSAPMGQQNNTYAVSPPYSIPPQSGNSGSFIPQTPYSPGYTSPGYQPPQQQGYQAGYSPYGQMGRAQPNPARQDSSSIPLNGGGYVPQKVSVRRKSFTMKDWYLVIMGAVLIALFVAAVIILNNPVLKIMLIVLAVGTASLLWIKPMVAENKRLTYSILAMALCVLTAVSFLMKQPNDVTNKASGSSQNTAAGQSGNTQNGTADQAAAVQKTETTPTPEPEQKDSDIKVRLVTFFTAWAGNRQDEMLELCSPNWVSKQENARTSLFLLLGNRRPLNCTLESITGTDADNSRKITISAKIDRNNGKNPEIYRMTILMVKENNEWFVDPQSLQSYETTQPPDPNVTPTFAPTATPAIYPTTVLYYNPNKGEYYHLDANCANVGQKYRPLQGQFTYAEINNEPYSKLKPCNVCGAPLR